MGFSLGKSQRQWLIVFLLVSLLLPIMFATLLVGIGNASGCQMVGKTAQLCEVKGIDIGQTIKMLVDWTWYIYKQGVFQIPIFYLGLFIGLLVLIYKSFRGWRSIFIGFFGIWYICFAPAIAGIVLVVYLADQAQCSLNEAGVGSCYLFGLDVADTFSVAAVLPWLLIILFPLCAIASVIYVVIALLNHKNLEP